MNELKDIGVGDEVLVEADVSTGGFNSKHFHIKAIVEKATKTQLTVNGTRYMRDTGREYGANSGFNAFRRSINWIYALENKYGYKDQTAEYEAFKAKMVKVKAVYVVANKVLDLVNYKTQNLDEIHEKLMQVKAHLDQIKKEKSNDTN